jgi:hypothetical protein
VGPWQLELGGRVIARFAFAEFDFPWTYAEITDSGEFDRYRVFYFTDEDEWPESPEFEAFLHEIQADGGFALRNVADGRTYRNFRLNQRENTIWFRNAGS